MNSDREYSNRIFVFASGWRTGSTLLQRAITSSKRVFVWGELHRLGDHIVQTFEGFDEHLEQYHHEGRFRQKVQSEYDNVEDANLAPPPDNVKHGLRQFLEGVYGSPIRDTSYEGWGWKTVRYGRRLYKCLKKIYPDAKFVFLVRNPYEAIESLKASHYFQESRIDAINTYIRLFREFHTIREEEQHGEDAFFVRFEDFVSSEKLRASLFDYLELPVIELEHLENTSSNIHVPLSEDELRHIDGQFDVMREFDYRKKYDVSTGYKWDVKRRVEVLVDRVLKFLER